MKGLIVKELSHLEQAIIIAESGLKWSEHKDFSRVYIALEGVWKILKAMESKADE